MFDANQGTQKKKYTVMFITVRRGNTQRYEFVIECKAKKRQAEMFVTARKETKQCSLLFGKARNNIQIGSLLLEGQRNNTHSLKSMELCTNLFVTVRRTNKQHTEMFATF